MFTDIKHEMDTPAVHKILSHVADDNSPEGIAEIIHKYQSRTDIDNMKSIVRVGACQTPEIISEVKKWIVN